MDEWIKIVGLTLMAGLAMPLGAILARFERIGPNWLEEEFRHLVIAFGGGVLLSAVALVLVPEGSEDLPKWTVALSFGGGGLSFMLLDRWLAGFQTHASQLSAMLSDFIPEALALGAAFAFNPNTAVLLAGLMTLQNLPEGFNAYREMTSNRNDAGWDLIGGFALMALLGPASGFAGYYWLSDFPKTVSMIMLFASGGILYLVIGDIAPQAKLERHWVPPLGAVAGFLLGLIGHIIISG
jgi:ZIP family zinc transporter